MAWDVSNVPVQEPVFAVPVTLGFFLLQDGVSTRATTLLLSL